MVINSDELPARIEDSLETALELQRRAKHTLKTAGETAEAAQSSAIAAMNMIELRKYSYRSTGVDDTDQPVMVTATLVEPTRTDIDEDLLRELVSDEVWVRITTTKIAVDRKKIDSAVAEGLLDLEVLERVVSYRDTNPYIRFKEAAMPLVEATDE